MAAKLFELSGTHFHHGVFEVNLEREAPTALRWIFSLGPLRARAIGMLILLFSFFFSTSRAPLRFLMELGYTSRPEVALALQQKIGYGIFGLAAAFYLTVFFFRKERLDIVFDKNSKIFSIIKEPLFRFSPTRRGHVTFADIQKVETLPPAAEPTTPHGRVRISAKTMPPLFREIEFKVLTDEQYEFFPLNIEKILGT